MTLKPVAMRRPRDRAILFRMAAPTPADVRLRAIHRDGAGESFPAWCRKQIESSFRELPALLEQLDRDLESEIKAWIADEGVDRVRVWLASDTSAAVLVRAWRQYVDEYPQADKSWTLLAVFVREVRICDEIGTIAAFMHSRQGEIESTVTRLRHDVALALVKNAYTVRFHLGVKLSRTCGLGRAYIESVLTDENATATRRIRRDYGKLAVISSRFGNASVIELERARHHLHAVLEEDHDVSVAAYLVESGIEEYHLSGDTAVIVETYQWAKDFVVPDHEWSNWWLVTGELMLHLAGAASTLKGRISILRDADRRLQLAQEVGNLEVTHEVRSKMLRAVVRFLQQEPAALNGLSLRGLRLPFGLRRRSALPSILNSAGEELIASLRAGAERGQYTYRDALAGILTHTARASSDRVEAQERLVDAIRLRGPIASKQPLRDLRSRLDQAGDRLLLAHLSGDRRQRTAGLSELVSLVQEFPQSPDALVAIANEIQANGPARLTAPRTLVPLQRSAEEGDYRAILQLAARIAITSRDFRRRALGGRGTTATLEDPHSISGQVFIIKEMTADCYHRDDRRTNQTQRLLAERGMLSQFGVVEHVLADPLPPVPDKPDSVLSVRRFEQGITLRAALSPHAYSSPTGGAAADSLILLAPAVDYLALFHSDPVTEKGSLSPRRTILVRELGRWLRQLPVDRDLIFAEWWAIVEHLPTLPRRDAHTQNWVVLSDGRLLAVDLESNGQRPLGYELAQLIDDEPVLEPNDLGSRQLLIERYRDALNAAGVGTSYEELWLGFQAAQAARAVSLLTDGGHDHRSVRHAIGLLETIARTSNADRLRDWSHKILGAWEIKAGRANPDTLAHFTEGRRRRISKAMAYHLRHNPTAPLDREGWIFAEDLAALLRSSGLRVEPATLLAVAGALGESRFELSDDSMEVRAAYGHSLRLHTTADAAVPPSMLWHGTALSSLDGIFAARSGLLPGARRHVHLSASIDQARHVARRHSDQTVVLQIDARTVEQVFSPVEGMWLAPHVQASAVRLPSVWRVAESAGLVAEG